MNIKSNKFFISFVALLLVAVTSANSFAYYKSTITLTNPPSQMDFITKTNYYPVQFRWGENIYNDGTDKYLIEKNTRNEFIISGTTQPNAIDNIVIHLPVAFMAEANPNWDAPESNANEEADGYTGTYPTSENYLLSFDFENIGPDVTTKSKFREVFGFTVSSNTMLKRGGSLQPASTDLVVANHGGASQWLQRLDRNINGPKQNIKLSFTWNVKAGVPELIFNFSNLVDDQPFKFQLSNFQIKKFAQDSYFTGDYVATLRSRILMWQNMFFGDHNASEATNNTNWDNSKHILWNGTANGNDKFETEAWHSHIRYVDDGTVSFGLPVSSLGVSSTSMIPLVYRAGKLQHASKYAVSFDLTIEDPYFYGSGYTSASGSRFSDMGAFVSSVFATGVGNPRVIDASATRNDNGHPYLYGAMDRTFGLIEGNLSRSRKNAGTDLPSPSVVPYPIQSLYGHRYSNHRAGQTNTTQITMRDSFGYNDESHWWNGTHPLAVHTSSHTLYFWAFNNNQTYGDVNGGHATASTNPWLIWEHGGSGHTFNCLPVVTFSNLECW